MLENNREKPSRTNRPNAKRLSRQAARGFRKRLEKLRGKKVSGRQWKKFYKDAQRRSR